MRQLIVLFGVVVCAASASAQVTDSQPDACVHGAGREAVRACTALLARVALDDGDKVASYLNRGNAYVSLGDLVRALKDFDSALAIDQQSAQARRAFASRAGALEEQAKLVRDEDRAALLERAAADYDRAIALGIQPLDVAYFNRGQVRYSLGHLEEAVSDFTLVLDTVEDTAALVARALALADQHRCDRAANDVGKVAATATGPADVSLVRQLKLYVSERCP